MSIIYEISCDSCPHKSGLLTVNYEFIGDPVEEPRVETCWCHDCNKMTPVIFPFTKSDAERIVEFDQNRYEQKVSSIGKRLESIQSKFRYRFSKKLKTEAARLQNQLKETKLKTHRKLESYQERISYFSNHSFEAQCLECKSLDIEAEWKTNQNIFALQPIGVTHRGCSGELYHEEIGHLSCKPSLVQTVKFDLSTLKGKLGDFDEKCSQS